jgi:tetratricopeptide (TPR) repeat protein
VALTRYTVDWMGSRAEPALRSLEEAASRARMLGDRRLERGILPFLIGTATHGPASPAEMERVAGELRARSDTIPSARRAAVTIDAAVAYLSGHPERSVELLDGLIDEFRELGDETGMLYITGIRAASLIRASRLREGIAAKEAVIESFRNVGLPAFLSTQLAELARMYYTDGRPDDALRLVDEVDAITADEDIVNFALTRCLRGRIYSDRGDHEEAERLARNGLAFALATDFPWVRGEANFDLAHVLAHAGHGDEARAAALAGIAEFEKKQDVVKLAEGRELLASIA